MLASRRVTREELSRVEQPIELTAESLWTEVPVGSGERSTRRPTRPGSARCSGLELVDDAFVLAVPNDFTREWIEGHFLGLIGAAVQDVDRLASADRAAARRRRPRREDGRGAGRGRASRAAPIASPARERRLQPEVHVRLVRHRLVEPVRARGRARRRRGAGPGVQPALHLRRHRPRQDAPPARDRAATSASTPAT